MLLLSAILFVATLYDFATYKIPNRLILLGWSLGILQILAGGMAAGTGIRKLMVCIVLRLLLSVGMLFLLIPLWRLHAFGGGDVKLLSVCTLLAGFESSINGLLYALFIGAAISLAGLAVSKVFPKHYQPKEQNGMHKIHFSLPIFLGMITQFFAGSLVQLDFF